MIQNAMRDEQLRLPSLSYTSTTGSTVLLLTRCIHTKVVLPIVGGSITTIDKDFRYEKFQR